MDVMHQINVPYHRIEGAETLWQMICASMREYWFEAIGIIQYRYRGNIINPYDGCTLDHPKPFFVDRTMAVDKFWSNIHSLDLKRMLVELNSEKTSLIPDVLCPWGCTEFCFEAVTDGKSSGTEFLLLLSLTSGAGEKPNLHTLYHCDL